MRVESNSQSIKLKERLEILVKLIFRELCDSKLSGLHLFHNLAMIHLVKNSSKNRKVGCEFMRQQFLKSFL